MSITDELRDYTEEQIKRLDMTKVHYRKLFAIADRIDAEHERAVMSAMNDALYHANDESMAELGWMRLPKDMNGETIRVGDVMEGEKVGGGFCEPFEVVGYITINGELEPMDEHKLPRKRKYLRHHYAPTVEDVLREFAVEVCGEPALTIRSGVVEEYAARLRLAGDDE